MRDQPGSTALYQRVAADLREQIAEGEIAPGGSLPSEAELGRRYGASRGTIRQALGMLRAEGVISSRRGARRTALGAARVQSFAELHSFSLWARATGEVPSSRRIELVHREATAPERAQLELAPGARVYHLTRVRLLGDEPVMIERTAYVERVGALLPGIRLDVESVTERLAELGVVLAAADHVIDAVPASTADARLLGVPARTALLRERRRTTDPDGSPVEWSEDRYLGDAVAFAIRNSVAASSLLRRAGSRRAPR